MASYAAFIAKGPAVWSTSSSTWPSTSWTLNFDEHLIERFADNRRERLHPCELERTETALRQSSRREDSGGVPD